MHCYHRRFSFWRYDPCRHIHIADILLFYHALCPCSNNYFHHTRDIRYLQLFQPVYEPSILQGVSLYSYKV